MTCKELKNILIGLIKECIYHTRVLDNNNHTLVMLLSAKACDIATLNLVW